MGTVYVTLLDRAAVFALQQQPTPSSDAPPVSGAQVDNPPVGKQEMSLRRSGIGED